MLPNSGLKFFRDLKPVYKRKSYSYKDLLEKEEQDYIETECSVFTQVL